MRLSLIAVAMCMAWLAGMTSAEARPYYGYGQHRAHANWSGKRHYSGRQVYSQRHYAQRRYATHRQYSQRSYSHRQYSYRQSSYRKYASRQGYRQGYHRQYAQRHGYSSGRRYASTGGSYGAGGRPRAWCGWWMRTQLGGGPEYNLAANWRNYGRPSGPQVGAVVVWPHHVGIITGRSADGRWVVKSGNDGNAVRERAQSVAGAVFRAG